MPNSRAASSHSVDSSDSVDLEQQNSTVRLSRARAQFLSIGANIDEINARHHAIKEAEQQLPEGSRSPKSFENEREVDMATQLNQATDMATPLKATVEVD
eukprot:Selendium_serpulae@DN6500_c3_g3_i2.p2